MAAPREYELVLMLDPGQDAPARDAVANEAKGQIEAAGTLKHENVWGLRKMAFEINRRTEADYRWFRFEAANELLEQLDHNLKIADGVLRFRVFKVDADAPVIAPPASSAPGPGASRERPSAEAAPTPAAPPVESVPEPAATEPTPVDAPAAVAEPPAEAEPVAAAPEPEAEAPEPAAEPETSDAPAESAEAEPGDSAA